MKRDPHARHRSSARWSGRAAHDDGKQRSRARRRSGSRRRRPALGTPSTSSSGAVTSRATGAAEPNAARSLPRSRSATRAREQTAMTIALRGPIFMKVCGCAAGRDLRRDDELVVGEGAPLDADEELGERDVARPANARDLDLRSLDQERRQRVARGRRGAEVPADRPAVADLRRPDGARGLGERRAALGELAHRLGVRQPGAEPERPVLARPAAELVHLVQVEEHVGPLPVEVEGHHDVGAALDRQASGCSALSAECLVERPRGEDVHADVLPFLAHVRPAERRGRTEAAPREAVETSTRTTIVMTYGSACRSSGSTVTPWAWSANGSADRPRRGTRRRDRAPARQKAKITSAMAIQPAPFTSVSPATQPGVIERL